MNNQRYIDYANYNIWANNRLIDCLLQQESAIMTQEVKGSFPNIKATIKHIWFAETGWLSTLQDAGWQADKVDSFQGSTAELFTAWQATSEAFKQFVKTEDLEGKVAFMSRGREYIIPAREIAQTVFNHGTYHRGQVVMMLRQLGITEIPQTDYIEWVRQNY